MKKLIAILAIAAIVLLCFVEGAKAAGVFFTVQGGTGTSSPSGILYGDNGATSHLNTVKIGSGINFVGGVLSAVVTAMGLSTSSPISGSNLLVYSSSGAGSAYGVATGTVSNGTGITVTAGQSVIGSGLTITNSSPLSGLSTSFPLSFSNPTLSWIGLATTSQPSSSNILVSNGSNGIYGVATSTLTASSPLTGSFTQIGSGGSVGCQSASGSQAGCLSSADWTIFNGKQAAGNYITALTGDITASGPGSAAATLATVNSNVGSFTNANITVNGKGLITAASNGFSYPFPLAATSTLLTFNGGLTAANSVTLSGITGSTQCLHVNSSGVISGTGSDCGSGGGGTGVGTLATSTLEASGDVPFATSNSAYPALLGFNSNLFWDNTNERLGIASSTPSAPLSVSGGIWVDGQSSSLIGTPNPTTSTFNAFNPTNNLLYIASSTKAGTILTTIVNDFEGSANANVQALNAGEIWGTGASANNTGTANGGGLRSLYSTMNASLGRNVAMQSSVAAITDTQGTLASTTSGTDFMALAPLVDTGNLMTTFRGLWIRNTAVNGTLTNSAGIAIENQTMGSNNSEILFGTSTVPSGNYGLYQSDSYNNTLNGNTGIGTTSPFAGLSVSTTSSNAFAIADAFNTTDLLFGTASTTGSIFTVAATTSPNLGSGIVKLFDVDQYGHLTASSTPRAPTLSCTPTNNGSLGTNSNDVTGDFTTGTLSTACTLTFGQQYATTPEVVTSGGLISSLSRSTTAITFTLSAAITGDDVSYFIIQP